MKLCIIGAGGIGSYLVKALDELINIGQISSIDIDVYDNDIVDQSNILYQDFSIDDVLENKAEALAKRYKITPFNKKITDIEDLKNYDLVVCCVDNTETRRLLFSNFRTVPQFIDLRAEGKSYAIYTKRGNRADHLLKTLPDEDVSGGSCQLAYDKNNGRIQQGNKIVALICSQLILDIYRGEHKTMAFRQSL